MATEIGTAYLSLTASTRGLSKDVKKSLGGVEGQAAATGKSAGSRLSSGISRGLKVGAAAGVAAVGAIGVAAVKAGTGIETAKRTLEGLYGSATKTQKTMAALRDVAGDSPIDYEAYTKAAESLAYAGVQGKSAVKILGNVGDAITAVGGDSSSMDRATDAVLKMVNAGKVSLDSLQQLSNSGTPIISGLAKHFGVSMNKINEMASAGAIGLDDVLDVMKNATGDTFQSMITAGENASKSFGNVWKATKDSIKSSLGETVVPLLEKMAPVLSKAAKAVTPLINKFADFISGMLDGKSDMSSFMAVLSPLGTVFKALWPAVKALGSQIKQVAKQIGTALQPLIPVLVAALISVLDAVQPILPMLGDLLVGAVKALTPVMSVLAKALGIIVKAAVPLIDPLVSLAEQIFPILVNIITTLAKALTPLLPVIADLAVQMFPVLAQIAQVVADALVQLAPIVETLLQAIMPILPPVMQLAQTLFPLLMKVLVAIMPLVTALIGLAVKLVDALMPVVTVIIDGVVSALTTLIGWITKGYKAISDNWDKITGAFKNGWKAVKGFLKKVWDFIKKVFSYNPISLITDNWDAITDAFKDGWQAVKGFLKKVWDYIKKVWTYSPIGLITENWDKITGFFSGIPGKIKQYFDDAINWLKDAGKNILKGLRSGIDVIWDKTTEFFTSLPGKVLDLFTSAGSWLYDTGKDIIQGLLDGAGSLLSTIGNFFLDHVPGWIKGPFKKALGIHSPSRVFHGYGKNIVQGLADGITRSKKTAKDAIKDLSDAVSKAGERAVEKEAKRINKARKKHGLSALSDKAATAQARSNLGYSKRAIKDAQRLIREQGKLTKTLWKSGQGDKLVKALTKHGKWLSNATKKMKNATLADFAKARQNVADQVKEAKGILRDLKDSRADLRASVASSVVGEVDLSKAISEDTTDAFGKTVKGTATFSSVKGVVSKMVAKAKKFKNRMRKLVATGLPSSLVQQISGLGMDEAIKVADAVLSGSKKQIKRLGNLWGADTESGRSTKGSLQRYADTSGKVLANGMYDAGIQAQKGLISGLKRDDKKLEAAAEHLAKRVTRSVKKKLGIKSPSRVFRDEVGMMLAAGTAVGVTDGSAMVDDALASLVDPSRVQSDVTASLRRERPMLGREGLAGSSDRLLTDADIDALTRAILSAPVRLEPAVIDGETSAHLYLTGRKRASAAGGILNGASV